MILELIEHCLEPVFRLIAWLWSKVRKPKPDPMASFKMRPMWNNPETWYIATYGVHDIREVLVYAIDEEVAAYGGDIAKFYYCQLPGDDVPEWHQSGRWSRYFLPTREAAKAVLLFAAWRAKSQAEEHWKHAQFLEDHYDSL